MTIVVVTCEKPWSINRVQALVVVRDDGSTEVHCSRDCKSCGYGKLIKGK